MDMNYRGGDVGGRGWTGWSGVKGGKWDNCNSIINKYILKKRKERCIVFLDVEEFVSFTAEEF